MGKESYVDPQDVATEYLQGGEEQDQANAEERRSKGEFVRGVSAFRHWLGGDDFPNQRRQKSRYRFCLTQRQSASLATRAPTLSKCLPGLEDWTFLRGLLWPIPSRKSMHVSTRTSTTERTVQVSPVTKNRTRMPRRTIFAR